MMGQPLVRLHMAPRRRAAVEACPDECGCHEDKAVFEDDFLSWWVEPVSSFVVSSEQWELNALNQLLPVGFATGFSPGPASIGGTDGGLGSLRTFQESFSPVAAPGNPLLMSVRPIVPFLTAPTGQGLLAAEAFAGFRDFGDNRRFGFVAQAATGTSPPYNWFAQLFDGDADVLVDTGVPVASICENASVLGLSADGEKVDFFVDGMRRATIPMTLPILGDNFRHGYTAFTDPTGTDGSASILTDWSCVSMGRKCQVKSPL